VRRLKFELWSVLKSKIGSALHCIVGAKLLNTLTNSSECTIVFSAITAIICFVVSLPRTLNQLAGLGTFSAVTMGLAVLLAVIFSGIQSHPAGFTTELGAPIVTSVPVPGTTFVLGTALVNRTLTEAHNVSQECPLS
jgi:hypothetical protein